MSTVSTEFVGLNPEEKGALMADPVVKTMYEEQKRKNESDVTSMNRMYLTSKVRERKMYGPLVWLFQPGYGDSESLTICRVQSSNT